MSDRLVLFIGPVFSVDGFEVSGLKSAKSIAVLSAKPEIFDLLSFISDSSSSGIS